MRKKERESAGTEGKRRRTGGYEYGREEILSYTVPHLQNTNPFALQADKTDTPRVQTEGTMHL